MEPNQAAAFELIEQAQQAMKKGELNTARQLAARAAQSAPELEEVWLLMAALASPRGSVAFIQKALDINPQSERAQKGMLWAQKRYQQELDKQAATTQKQAASEAPTAPPAQTEPPIAVPVEPIEEKPIEAAVESFEPLPDIDKPIAEEEVSEPVVAEPPAEEKTSPTIVSAVSEPKTSPRQPVPVAVPVQDIQAQKTAAEQRSSNLTIPLIAVGVLALLSVIFIALLSFTPAAALINSTVFNGKEHGPAWAPVTVVKTDSGQPETGVTAVPTATLQATLAPEMPLPSVATETTISLSTATQLLPTNTPAPTQIPPTPTATLLPTSTFIPTIAVPTATVEVAAVEGASPTPLPTDTAMPAATPYVAPTARASSGGTNTTTGASSGRWIDVDLTHQAVYAYDGNTVVNSFIVSTGTWQHPTVTGQYHVYVKYRSTTMSGPGYSLPNVPYTMYFYKGYGLHGTYWHSNFGTPMSHGCVNLSIPDAEWLYNWASVGTLVNVHY